MSSLFISSLTGKELMFLPVPQSLLQRHRPMFRLTQFSGERNPQGSKLCAPLFVGL